MKNNNPEYIIIKKKTVEELLAEVDKYNLNDKRGKFAPRKDKEGNYIFKIAA